MRILRVGLSILGLISIGVFASCSDSKKLDELTKQVEVLNKAIVIGADGNPRLATPTPVAIAEYKQYGFGLPIPSTVKLTAASLTGKEATNDNGSVLGASGGTTLFLVWNKENPPFTPQESVVGGFELLKSLTGAQFEAMGAGAGLTVDQQPGAFGTFGTRDAAGKMDGIGIIGGWVCPNDKRSYAMTVTGKDLEPVQQSFVYLTNGFRCDAGKTQAAPTQAAPKATATATATAKP